ncbi:MAG: hypothetical protein U9R19_06175 [Bacteroidota bacterium]|nr:hypothetical protein [Bacteroidota bacterium]
MKKTLLVLVICLLQIAFSLDSFAQFKIDFDATNRTEGSLAYNFFVGDDADMFQTTIKGFGSGFLLDMFTGRYSSDMVSMGWEKFNLTMGLGIAITKYRFEENLVLEKVGDNVNIFIDTDPNHDYQNTFFGYGKSKIVYGSLFTPVNLNLILGKMKFSAGAMLDFYISGKHKRKYIEDGEKKKIKVGNSDFSKYNLSKTKLGLNGRIEYIPLGLNISVTYMATPFFNDSSMPEINEMRIAIGTNLGKKYLDKVKSKTNITKSI